ILRGPGVPALVGAARAIQSRLADFAKAAQPPQPVGKQGATLSVTLDDAANALGLEVVKGCKQCPVLYRTFSRAAISPDVIAALSPSGEPFLTTRGGARTTSIYALNRLLFTTLQKAWNSNVDLRDKIRTDPRSIWKYHSLIHAALDELAKEEPELSAH